MFQCSIGRIRDNVANETHVTLWGCPRDGLAAIDWRKAHDLPAAPSNQITIPGYLWTDEEFVRQNPDMADSNADIHSEYCCRQYLWSCNASGEVYQSQRGGNLGDGSPTLQASVVRAYLAEQTPETARAVLMDVVDMVGHSKAEAKAKAEAIRQKKAQQEELLRQEKAQQEELLRQARQLLASDLDRLRGEVDYWKQRAIRAEVALAEIEADSDPSDEE